MHCAHSQLAPIHLRRVDLAEDFFIGIVLQVDRAGRALRVAQTIAFAKDRVHRGLLAHRRVVKFDGVISTRRNARSARYAVAFGDAANRAGGCHRVFRQQIDRAARGSVGLADRLLYMLRIVSSAAQKYAIRGEIDWPELYMSLLEETVRTQGHLEQLRQLIAR